MNSDLTEGCMYGCGNPVTDEDLKLCEEHSKLARFFLWMIPRVQVRQPTRPPDLIVPSPRIPPKLVQ